MGSCFVHISKLKESCDGKLIPGDLVSFCVAQTHKGATAHDVELIKRNDRGLKGNSQSEYASPYSVHRGLKGVKDAQTD